MHELTRIVIINLKVSFFGPEFSPVAEGNPKAAENNSEIFDVLDNQM